ncbi:hypothetical protein ACWNT8_13315 [Pigmentibacter ruber]|nr:hypothetical protein GTC16762_13400 [Pigmentibacter ruber]
MIYATLGFIQAQMASLIGKSKRLKREGHFSGEDFKQIKVPTEQNLSSEYTTVTTSACGAAELVLPGSKLVRFSNIDFLFHYLKKSA